ncbi:capsule biosynthesis GfcC D2 domain-containing protein [Vibrio owensii]|uniref:capsule biosynthesis GfcC D2 domain-containing protein n=1 Tax=Vibrio owensii TaxID=696485 RepID=UPI002FEF12A6
MRFRVLLLTYLALWSTTANSESKSNDPAISLELLGGHKILQFEDATRLSDIIIQAKNNGASLDYPLASALFDTSSDANNISQNLKQKVLLQLEHVGQANSSLFKFIESHEFAPRLISYIDFDQIRLDRKKNPLLKGSLALSTPERIETITFVGNIARTYKKENYKGLPLSTVLEDLELLATESRLAPVVIYPDAQIVFPKSGSWDTKEYYLPPLSIVYIPFEEYATSQLDKDIVKLLTQLKTPL